MNDLARPGRFIVIERWAARELLNRKNSVRTHFFYKSADENATDESHLINLLSLHEFNHLSSQIVLVYFYLMSPYRNPRNFSGKILIDGLDLARYVYRIKRIQKTHRHSILKSIQFLAKILGRDNLSFIDQSFADFRDGKSPLLIFTISKTAPTSYRKISWDFVRLFQREKSRLSIKLKILLFFVASSYKAYRFFTPGEVAQGIGCPAKSALVKNCLMAMSSAAMDGEVEKIVCKGKTFSIVDQFGLQMNHPQPPAHSKRDVS